MYNNNLRGHALARNAASHLLRLLRCGHSTLLTPAKYR